MMSLVWTKSDKIGSKLIRWCTGSSSSHMAWIMDSRIVFHSTFSRGVHLTWLHNFLNINQVVHRIDFDLTLPDEESIYQSLIYLESRGYDYGAFFYLGFMYLKYKIFGTPLPPKNKWSSSNRYICLEMAKSLKVIGLEIPYLDSTDPEGLYKYIKDKYGHIPYIRA